MRSFFDKIIKHVLHLLSRWKILTAYALFSVLVLSGWYIDFIGVFSSQEDFAANFRTQHGDMNLFNVLAFLIGTIFYLGFMVYDYLKLRLDRIQYPETSNKASSVFGNTTQAITQNSSNSPVVTAAGTIINYNSTGISEERCRAIFDEKWAIAIKELTFESIGTAESRRKDFQTTLLPRLEKEKEGFKAFADPSFQFLLMEAQRSAASTDREVDFQLLSELLAQRAKGGGDRRTQIHIRKSVEVLPDVSDEALLGLTVSFMLLTIIPLVGNIRDGLKKLEETYSHVIGDKDLPLGDRWIESLYACSLLNMSMGDVLSLNKAMTIFVDKMDGYCLPGIKKYSDDYNKAISILTNAGLSVDGYLVEHELNSDYVRVAIVKESKIDSLKFINELPQKIKITIYLSDDKKAALHNVFALYEKTEVIKAEFVRRFEEEISSYPYLKKVIDWWNQIPVAYQLTLTGQTLASANASICDSNIPILGQEDY